MPLKRKRSAAARVDDVYEANEDVRNTQKQSSHNNMGEVQSTGTPAAGGELAAGAQQEEDEDAPALPDGFEDEEIDEDAAFEPDDTFLAERFGLEEEDNKEGYDGMDDKSGEEDEYDEIHEPHRRALVSDIEQVATSAKQHRRAPRRLVQNEALPERAENAANVEHVSVQELMDAAGAEGRLRKRLNRLGQTVKPEQPPLPERVRAKQERKAAYERSAQDVSKWHGAVQKNRKARTLDLRAEAPQHHTHSTIGSVATHFAPSATMEREVSDLLRKASASHGTQATSEQEEAEQLGRMSFEEAKRRKDRLAKMRALLFKHEERAKRLKRIKSKSSKRRERKSRRAREQRIASGEVDEEEARKAQEQAELERAKERMTLKHRNTSRWAKRSLKKGLQKQPGTKEALNEQLRIGEELMERVNKTQAQQKQDENREDTESEDGAEEDDEHSDSQTRNTANGVADNDGKYNQREKQEALSVLSGNADAEELPSKGLFALPFIRRAVQRKQQDAQNEAREMLEEEESLENEWQERNPLSAEAASNAPAGEEKASTSGTAFNFNASELKSDRSVENQSAMDLMEIKNREAGGAMKQRMNSGTASGATNAQKMELKQGRGAKSKEEPKLSSPESNNAVTKGTAGEQNALRMAEKGRDVTRALESDESGGVSEWQRQLISQAFADDDVAEEFAHEKQQDVQGELPAEEAEEALPGWGEWASKQKGAPKFIQRQREADRQRREAALKARRDAKKPNVILSERYDRLAATHSVQSLPHPHTSRAAFDATMRIPIGREYNSDAAFREFTRPEILQQPGQIIRPLPESAKAQ